MSAPFGVEALGERIDPLQQAVGLGVGNGRRPDDGRHEEREDAEGGRDLLHFSGCDEGQLSRKMMRWIPRSVKLLRRTAHS